MVVLFRKQALGRGGIIRVIRKISCEDSFDFSDCPNQGFNDMGIYTGSLWNFPQGFLSSNITFRMALSIVDPKFSYIVFSPTPGHS